jgi:hypothetical protein
MDQLIFDPNTSALLVGIFEEALKPLLDVVHSLHHERSELRGSASHDQSLKSQINALQQTIQEHCPPGPDKVLEPERHIIKIIIGDDVEAIQALSRQTLLHYVQNIEDEYQHVISVEFVNVGQLVARDAQRRTNCFLLIVFNDYDTKRRARNQVGKLYDAFGFTHATKSIPDIYLLEILYYYPWGRTRGITGGDQPDEKEEMDLLVRDNFPEFSQGCGLRARISFARVYLETSNLKDALKLDGSVQKIYGQEYKIK